MRRVEEYIARQVQAGKKDMPQYEAARMLGIKPGELDEYLNPGVSLNRKIVGQL